MSSESSAQSLAQIAQSQAQTTQSPAQTAQSLAQTAQSSAQSSTRLNPIAKVLGNIGPSINISLPSFKFNRNSELKGDHGPEDVQSLSVSDPSLETQPQTINVVLFGETGVGKSSVINLIARANIAKVSSDVNGCTMQYQRYPISFDNMDFAIFDTIGLEEPQMGVNGYLKAIEKAYELISRLGAAGGIHLLLFCMRGGRITATTQSNYRLFCECLCHTKVPIALVFTGLEREDKMENWWDRNKTHIEHYGIKSNGHACITAVQDDTPGDERKFEESQETIRKLLKTCALKGEAFSPESHSWFAGFMGKFRGFVTGRRSPKKKDILKVLINRCKLDPDTAKKIAEMMDKGDTENKDEVGEDPTRIPIANDISHGEQPTSTVPGVATTGEEVTRDDGLPQELDTFEGVPDVVASGRKDKEKKSGAEGVPHQESSDVKALPGVVSDKGFEKSVADAGTPLQEPSDVEAPLRAVFGGEAAKKIVADAGAPPRDPSPFRAVPRKEVVKKNMADHGAPPQERNSLRAVPGREAVKKNTADAGALLQERGPLRAVSEKEVTKKNTVDAEAPLQDPSSGRAPLVAPNERKDSRKKSGAEHGLPQESRSTKVVPSALQGKRGTGNMTGVAFPQEPGSAKAAHGVATNRGKDVVKKNVGQEGSHSRNSTISRLPSGKEMNNTGKPREKVDDAHSERRKIENRNAKILVP